MDEMTRPEINAFLETLAKLVEATAKNPQDAARIIREAKPENHSK
jgi:ABC-type nitrate/sulfonate/bicarbonate transport system substrate-binding protein